MTPKVAVSPFPSAWLSGITSSTTTKTMAPAAMAMR